MGLIPQLSKRLGMLKRLSRYMSIEKLKYFSSGIFYSKLNYCLPVFGNIFGLEKYKDENRIYFSFTMKDNNNIQVLQNKLNRLLLNADYTTPTSELLDQTGSLSVHQMTAYHTALTTHKIIQSGKPSYIAEKFKIRNTRLTPWPFNPTHQTEPSSPLLHIDATIQSLSYFLFLDVHSECNNPTELSIEPFTCEIDYH